MKRSFVFPFGHLQMVIVSSMPVQDSLSPMKDLQIYYIFSYEKYSLHPLFEEISSRGIFRTFSSIFVASISNFIFDLGLARNVEYAKPSAMNIDSSVYVPFLAVLALGNALGSSIQLYTKPLIDQRHPFEKDLSHNGPIYLFWGSMTASDQLDHFVPLFNELDSDILL